MGIFASLFGGAPKRFISEKRFRTNVQTQTSMTPRTLAQLRQHGVSPSHLLKLEYFFYTDDPAKAAALAAALKKLGYTAESGPSAGNSRVQLVTGRTAPLPMVESALATWTEQMCQLGFDHDAEFDGWGTEVPKG